MKWAVEDRVEHHGTDQHQVGTASLVATAPTGAVSPPRFEPVLGATVVRMGRSRAVACAVVREPIQ